MWLLFWYSIWRWRFFLSERKSHQNWFNTDVKRSTSKLIVAQWKILYIWSDFSYHTQKFKNSFKWVGFFLFNFNSKRNGRDHFFLPNRPLFFYVVPTVAHLRVIARRCYNLWWEIPCLNACTPFSTLMMLIFSLICLVTRQ